MAPETQRSFFGGFWGGNSRPLTISVALMYIGIAITLVFVIAALFAPLMQSWGWIQDPTAALANPIHEPPSAAHWFGTTRQGYDVFSRTLFGTAGGLAGSPAGHQLERGHRRAPGHG